MNNYKLSILIPSRSEMFLKNTVENILKNIEADTEIIVVLDGQWANPPVDDHERVNIIYTGGVVGQRAGTNMACRLSRAKYVMKVDAHCSFDKGFDRKMLEGFRVSGDNVTMVPMMYNLWAFDWKCYKCGSRWYQGPTPTRCMRQEGTGIIPNEGCDEKVNFKRKITWRHYADKGETAYQNWKGRRDRVHSPCNTSYCFNQEPKFQYFSAYKHRPEYKKDWEEKGLTETMSLQGSCFMCTREKYWELNICEEKLGNWGNQGIEVALKTWLSGGRVLCNHRTWYSHLFRTQGGDFGFPWPHSSNETQKTKNNVKELFWDDKWEKAIHPLSWLIEKFAPVPGWEDISK